MQEICVNDTVFDILKQKLEQNKNLTIKSWSGQELELINRHTWQDILETGEQ